MNEKALAEATRRALAELRGEQDAALAKARDELAARIARQDDALRPHVLAAHDHRAQLHDEREALRGNVLGWLRKIDNEQA